jgi:tetratricopeptide (TPR) repeat protein
MTGKGMTALAFAAAIGLAPPLAAQRAERILVMPFENLKKEGRIFWLGEASAVLLADNLNALGFDAITRDERRYAFERLQVPPAASLTDATLIRIGQLVGAAQIVVGTLQMEGDDLVVRARSIALEAGRVRVTASERGPIPELFGTFERLTRQLAPTGGSFVSDGKNGHPTVAAFENYIKGLLAETPATAISYLTACLKADPGFDRARLALWDVYQEKGDYESALAAALAVAPGSRWALRSKFLVGLAQLHLKRHDDAFNTFKALSEAKPSAAALNNLGVVQIRRGNLQAGTGAPLYFKRATETDPAEPDYFFNLGYAYWLERDMGAAIYWLREALRRNPTDGDAHYVLGAVLQGAGNLAEANRERELAKRLSSTYAAWEKRPPGEVVPRGLERTKDDLELPPARRLDGTLSTTGQRDQQELAKFYLERAQRLYDAENDREALAELNRALFLSPYEAEAHMLVGRIHLRGGRFREAIDALKISLWSDESAAGHVALANAYSGMKDSASARAEVERALVLDPASGEARRLLETLPPR